MPSTAPFPFRLLGGAAGVGRGKVTLGDAGAQDVDAVERCLGGDLLLLAGEGEAGVGDLELEVLADAPAVPDLADCEPDRALAGEGALRDAGPDLGERALGRGEQVVALA